MFVFSSIVTPKEQAQDPSQGLNANLSGIRTVDGTHLWRVP